MLGDDGMVQVPHIDPVRGTTTKAMRCIVIYWNGEDALLWIPESNLRIWTRLRLHTHRGA